MNEPLSQSARLVIDALIEREGGFVDHPDDRGGPTCWGITQAVAREAGYAGPMAELPRVLAESIYLRRYWQAPGFDRVAAIFPRVAEELLDTGVNMGPATALRFLLRSLNALNRRGRDWGDLAMRASVDDAVLAALAAFAKRRGGKAEAVLLKALNGLQVARYIDIAERRDANESFMFGWLDSRIQLG